MNVHPFYAALEFAQVADLALPHPCPNVRAWFARFAERPSAGA